ncbi:MAG: hypothetical protein WCK02_01675 [Bacteroidota bacterium]
MNGNYNAKRSYHPLIQLKFYAGCLEHEIIKQIPASTIQYWKSIAHENLYGFEWVKDDFNNFQNIETTIKEDFIKKSIHVCSRVLFSFATVFASVKGYKNLFRKNATTIINAIDRISPITKLKSACRVFKITTNQYYRWKNKINCSASVLNLCFKTHPHQLTAIENMHIEDAVNAPENFIKRRLSIFYDLQRKGLLYCASSTFYKYSSMHFGNRIRYKAILKNNFFRASMPYEYIHIDTTFVRTELEGRFRVVFVKDNYSKAILHHAIAPAGDSRSLLSDKIY